MYSRFRTGEMPIAIDSYTLFNLLNVSAPEIRGMWDMVPIPGTVRADGTVDRSVTGAGNGIVMFEKTANKEAAWAFMEWWTSAETQTRFGREIEILMGPAARFDTANIEAFRNLPWTAKQRERLLGQWSQIRMVPQTPVNYYIGRNLTNAFRRVVIKGENSRETLNYYNRFIDKEILRKRKEFGLD
jgi:ABC-type glycerol-3-phosphate transport system substrate-binding protein